MHVLMMNGAKPFIFMNGFVNAALELQRERKAMVSMNESEMLAANSAGLAFANNPVLELGAGSLDPFGTALSRLGAALGTSGVR